MRRSLLLIVITAYPLAGTAIAATVPTPPAFLLAWGSNGAAAGQFSSPYDLATDAVGDVYVADTYNHRIQKFTGTGTYLTQWGSIGSGPGQFDLPWAVATDATGNVYVADYNNHRIQKFTGTGTYLIQWAISSGNPVGVATDGDGNVYIAEGGAQRIQKFTGTGTYLTQWGSVGSGDGQFNYPYRVATDAAGNVYVADYNNHRIQKFTGTGTYLTQWGSVGSGPGQFSNPVGVTTDAAGNVYVADYFNQRIQEFTGAGTYLTQWGSIGSGPGQFSNPVGVATDAGGNVYVVEYGNNRIQKFGDRPPDCSRAVATPSQVWPPDHRFVPVSITGVTDPDGDPVTLTVTRVSQDGPGCADGVIDPDGVVEVRAERSGDGNGRVYAIWFRADDGRGGGCEGSVEVCVPHDRQHLVCVDDGQGFNSLGPCPGHDHDRANGPSRPARVTLAAGASGASGATLRYSLPTARDVLLSVYDIAGRRVMTLENAPRSPGAHEVTWSTSSLARGIYFYRLRAGQVTVTKSLLITK